MPKIILENGQEVHIKPEICEESFSDVWTSMVIIYISTCDIINFDINQGVSIENFDKSISLFLKIWTSIYL